MKAEDLMIGDWVIRKGIPDEPMQIVGYNEYKNLVYMAFDGLGITEKFDGIEPIPITSEFLEKNGFKKENGEYWNIGKNQYGNTMYLNEVSYGYIVCTKCFDSDEYVYLYECKYVHELQHTINSHEIEKIIII